MDKVIRCLLFALAVFLPFSISGSQMVLALLVVSIVARTAILRRFPKIIEPCGGLILAMLVWIAIAALFAPYPEISLPKMAKYWIWLTYFVVLAAADNQATIRRAVLLMIASMGVVAVYGIAQHFFGDAVPRYLVPPVRLWQKTGGYYHAVGLFDHHLTYGNSVAFTLLLGLGLWLEIKGGPSRRLVGVALILGLLALMWSYARSAWIGLVAGLLTFGALKGKRALLGALIGIVIVILAASWLSPTIADRFQRSINSEKNLERIYTWKTTLDMIRDHPWTGIGPGAYRKFTESYRQGYNIHWTASSHAHNSYLQIAAESGILAGLLFLLLLVCLIGVNIFRLRVINEKAEGRNLLAGAISAMAVFAASSLMQHNAGDAEVCMAFLFGAALMTRLNQELARAKNDVG